MKINKNMAYLAGTIALLGGFAWAMLSIEPPPARDPDTYCALEEPSRDVALLVDASTPLDQLEQGTLAGLTEYIVSRSMDTNDRLLVYALSETITIPPVSVFEGCHPGKVKAGDGYRARNANKDFYNKVDEAIKPFMTGKELNSSPIIEGLSAITQTNRWKLQGMKVFVYSDLLQHSALLSNYGKPPKFPCFKTFYQQHKSTLDRLKPNLTGADVHVFLQHNQPLSQQRYVQRHMDFWTGFLKFSGARSVQFCALDKSSRKNCITTWTTQSGS